jgi:hypothetical protein
VLVSHDMRLISQVANELWICDHKTITQYKDDIHSFKMKMRHQMGITGNQAAPLRGDASVKQKVTPKDAAPAKKKAPAPNPEVILPVRVAAKKTPAPVVEEMKPTPLLEVIKPTPAPIVEVSTPKPPAPADDATPITSNTSVAAESSGPQPTKYVPPHMRRKLLNKESN